MIRIETLPMIEKILSFFKSITSLMVYEEEKKSNSELEDVLKTLKNFYSHNI
jgi:hypothetical protein